LRGLRIPERKRARELRANETTAEDKLWQRLRNRRLGGFKFVRQLDIGPYYADFACREAKLIVEVDGATHSTDEELAYDARRTRFLEAQGYRVLRFYNVSVYENLDGVAETILAALEKRKTL
jgi:very-short-patch-repair endonuclease